MILVLEGTFIQQPVLHCELRSTQSNYCTLCFWTPLFLHHSSTGWSMHSYSWLKGTKSIKQLIWFHFTSFSKAF